MLAVGVSDERFHRFLEVSKKYYSWDIILESAGITEYSDKGDQYELSCILHDDKRPSLRLSKRLGTYHCFSCGASGSFTRFMWELDGRSVPYSTFCDRVLKANPAMQSELGFKSLFVNEKTLDSAFDNRRVFNKKAHVGSDMPLTVLADKVRSVDDTWESLAISLVMLQQGVKSDTVYSMIKKRHDDVARVENTSTPVSLMDIIN